MAKMVVMRSTRQAPSGCCREKHSLPVEIMLVGGQRIISKVKAGLGTHGGSHSGGRV